MSRRSHTGPGEAYQMLVSRPGPHGPNESLSFDIFEADFLHPTFKKRAGAWLHVGSSGCVDEYVVEFKRGGLRLQRAVRGCPCEIEIDTFNQSARYYVTKCPSVLTIIADVLLGMLTPYTA